MATILFSDAVDTVFGDYRVRFGTVTLSGVTSGSFDTGLQIVKHAQFTTKSRTTTNETQLMTVNVASGGTAANGEILIQSGTAGDSWHALVIGN